MKRPKVGSYPQLNISKLSRQGFLLPGIQFDWAWKVPGIEQGNILIQVEEERLTLRYIYSMDAAETLIAEHVPIVAGEKRKWFQCPKCQQPVGILYGVSGRFLCRKCHGLVYPSQYPFHPDGFGRKTGSFGKRAFSCKGPNPIPKGPTLN
ncbi:MAG: hypothetical protein KC643_33810 [Nitrospira sp.]|nr:hypothetical protein [Nitrospira sp.]